MKRTVVLLTAATALIAVSSAQAGRLDLDVNAIRVNAGQPFSLNYTGQLDIGSSAQTKLVDVSIDHKSKLAGNRAANIDGYLDLLSGDVTGGMFTLTVLGDNDLYTARVVEDSGKVVQAIQENGRYQIGGLTFQGEFTDGNGDGLFAGVDLESPDFDSVFFGNFLLHDFKPDMSGVGVADIEFRAVPLPAAALLACPLLLGIPVLRRLRHR